MDGATRNLILPAFIGTAVMVIAVTLLFIVGHGPYTHSNLNAGFDPRYTRTVQDFVGTPVPFVGMGLAVARANDPVELGKQLFVANDCAACHGLDGRGGIIGPSIVGVTAEKLRSKATIGPAGMPAFAPDAFSDADVAAMAAYLEAMAK